MISCSRSSEEWTKRKVTCRGNLERDIQISFFWGKCFFKRALRHIITSLHMYIRLGGGDYVLSDFGGICSDTRKHPLLSSVECKEAAVLLDHAYHEVTRDVNYPKGCFASRDGVVYWIDEHTGPTRYLHAAGVCQSASRS